jgi:predicted nucleotidyltransferase
MVYILKMNNEILNSVIKLSGIHPSRVQNVYLFGSRSYGTATGESDHDFIVVCNNPFFEREIRVDNYNIHLMTMDIFLSKLKNHLPTAVEAFYLPEEFKFESIKIDWSPNRQSLRHSFSHVSSNSWVKAKKKIQQGDYQIGIKSLFHSLRIPLFGSQISKFGKIIDFSEGNWIWDDLQSKIWTWEDLDIKFRPIRNKILSDFRESSPKI